MRVAAFDAAIAAGLGRSRLPIADAVISPMPPVMTSVMGRRATAITLGRVIFVRPDRFDRVARGDDPELLAHELIHVAQWLAHGPIDFLVAYLGDYLRLRLLGLGHDAAYRHIGFEWAAYGGARNIVDRG